MTNVESGWVVIAALQLTYSSMLMDDANTKQTDSTFSREESIITCKGDANNNTANIAVIIDRLTVIVIYAEMFMVGRIFGR
jgi:hypothetical protein